MIAGHAIDQMSRSSLLAAIAATGGGDPPLRSGALGMFGRESSTLAYAASLAFEALYAGLISTAWS